MQFSVYYNIIRLLGDWSREINIMLHTCVVYYTILIHSQCVDVKSIYIGKRENNDRKEGSAGRDVE